MQLPATQDVEQCRQNDGRTMDQESSIPITTATPSRPDLSIRVGSPFAVDPVPLERVAKPIESFYDVGPIRYTAMGAVTAAIMVIGFGAAAVAWFPAGGVLIAALGCGLSLFAMASVYRKTAIALLLIHLGIFVLSYVRTIS